MPWCNLHSDVVEEFHQYSSFDWDNLSLYRVLRAAPGTADVRKHNRDKMRRRHLESRTSWENDYRLAMARVVRLRREGLSFSQVAEQVGRTKFVCIQMSKHAAAGTLPRRGRKRQYQ